MYKKTTTIIEEFENSPITTAVPAASISMSCPSAIHAEPALMMKVIEYVQTTPLTVDQVTALVERMYMMSADCTVLAMSDYPAIVAA